MHPFALEPKALSNQMLKMQVLASSCPRPATSLGKVWESAWPHADYMLCILCTTCCMLCKQDKVQTPSHGWWPLECLTSAHLSSTGSWCSPFPASVPHQALARRTPIAYLLPVPPMSCLCGGPDTPPTCMFFLFLFTWLILAHIFKPNLRILCIWYLCARIKKYFIHSTNNYKGLSTCQALFWDLVVDTTDKRTYLHITHILQRKTNKKIFKNHVKYMICQIKLTWRKIKQDEVWGEHRFGEQSRQVSLMMWQMSRNLKNGCPRKSNNIHRDAVSECDCMIEAGQGCPCGCCEGSEKEKRMTWAQKGHEKPEHVTFLLAVVRLWLVLCG